MVLRKLVTICIALFCVVQANAQGITLNGEYTLENAFKEIEKQSGYNFFYNYDLVQQAKKVTVRITALPLDKALDALLKDQPFVYSIQNKTIIIRSRTRDANDGGSAYSTETEIKGRVVNEEGEGLIGVVVSLKGTGKTAATNDLGYFTLKLEPAEAKLGTLVLSYVGYEKRELKIDARTQLEITMQKKVSGLTDVVVTSSYTAPKRKEEVVGSIVTVNAKDLQVQRPIESFDKMLEGLAAGVQVQTNTELGTPVKINIRGQNALTNLFNKNQTQLTTSSQPLYVIDGVPVIEQRRGDEPIAFLNNETLLNPLAGINPSDIESISVLKDAAAAAIYGANASNGVIIITTKRGKAGKTRFNVGYSYGWSRPINQIKWLTGQQYHELVKELYINDGRDPFTAETLAGSSDINTPWFELTNRYGQYHNIDFDLSGGNENTRFRLSAMFLDQQSMQKGNDYQKLSFNLRIDHAISRKFNLSASLAPTIVNKNGLNIYSNVPIIPNVPSYNADGTFFQLSTLNVPNPLAVLAQNVDRHSGGTLTGNLRLDYQVTKTLRLSSSVGINGLLNKQNLFQSPLNATGASKNGFAEIYDRTNFSWVTFNQATWTSQIKRHGFDVTAGFEAQSQSTRLLRGAGTGFTYYRLNELSNAQSQSSASSKQISSSYSVYGQMAYNYDKRYFINIAGRYDAASIFGPDINSTVNASVGGGWNISKEKLFDRISFIDLLRLRLSYGTTGNSRIGSYQAKGIYTFNNTGYNGFTASNPSTAPNPDLGWEKSYKFNMGIDLNFLKRFSVVFDVYQNIVEDAISTIRIPAVNGFTTSLANVAKMRNRGFDVSVRANILDNKFKWNVVLNGGYNKNIILSVRNNSFQFSDNATASLLRTGVSTSAIWGFEFAGVDQQTGTPMYRTSDGKVVAISQLDRSMANGYWLGDRLPKLQGGFINNFSYAGFSLDVNITYSFGAKDLIDYNLEADGNNLTNRNGSVNLMDRWNSPGDVTMIPRLSLGIPVVNSSRYVYDASFIKIGNIALSYVLPEWKKLRSLRATLFINATNVLYWYQSSSPEGRNGYREYRFGAFPESQTINWGGRINI